MLCCFGSSQKKGYQKEDNSVRSDSTTSKLRGAFKAEERQSWLSVSKDGDLELKEVNTQWGASQFGLYERDVVQLASKDCLWGPARILVKPQAVILSFGFLRVIFGASEALILSVPDQAGLLSGTTPYSNNNFIRDLISRLRITSHNPEVESLVDKGLPFQLVVLEWALSIVAKLLADATLDFERKCIPFLEEISTKVTRKGLIRMRHIKTDLSSLLYKVEATKQELRYLLEDDVALLSIYHLGVGLGIENGSNDSGTFKRPRPRGRSQRRMSGKRERSTTDISTCEGDIRALAECRSLVQCYLIQVEGANSLLRSVSSSSSSTETTMRLNLKHQRARLSSLY